MKNEHVLSELSAYIDGESADAERIARHLQQCPSCARRYMELSKVSSHVRAMRGPDVHPAFCTRVMAEAAEVSPAPRVRRWVPVLSTVVVAALVFCAGWGAYVGLRAREPEGDVGAFAGLDDSRILEEIERRVAQGEEVTLALPSMSASAVELEDSQAAPGEASLLEAIAEGDWAEGFPVALGGGPDVTQSIEALDEEQQAVFKELLVEYALEDVAS